MEPFVKTPRTHVAPRALTAVAALSLAGCAADASMNALVGRGTNVVDGTITWERPEVGTLYIGGGMCTATLITPQVAVTAAHCVDFGSTSRPGSYGRFVIQASATSPQMRYTVDMYRAFGRDEAMDVAIVHLAEAVPVSVATPAAIARRHPDGGDAVTLFGYGCTRRNTSIGSGQKRKFQFAQGQATARLCPGDSGGPVVWDRWGAVLRVNSAYIVDATGRDLFGDVPLNYSRIVDQIAAWGSPAPRTAEDGSAPPPARTMPRSQYSLIVGML